MKKFFTSIFVFGIFGLVGYFVYTNYFNDTISKVDVEEEKVSVSEYFIYGNHLNIKGFLKIEDMSYDRASLVLYDGNEKEYDINVNKEEDRISFFTSEYLNDGMFIDDLNIGTYYLFLKIYYDVDSEDEMISKYYALNNDTDYDNITYYTLSKYGNKIDISEDDEYGTFLFNVKENDDEDIYDIVIDPGHGGLDSGALAGKYKESDFTMDISLKIKDYVEKKGYSVKLTHDEDDIASDEVMDKYNEHGRAVIPNEVKAKYTFSIHINKNTASSVKGIEVYTAEGINYDFAKNIADNIVSNTGFGYSNNKMYKIDDGIYTHNFTKSEITSSLSEYDEKGYKRYDMSTKSNYLFMIRETGGYMTGAYFDDRNKDKLGSNPYYNSNVGNESYLLELGYLSNSSDLSILNSDIKKLAYSVGEAIVKELETNE